MESAFSNGLYLANLAVSSNILMDSWNAISEHRREEPGTFIKEHPDYRIIAVVGSSISDLGKVSDLVPVSKISDFQLLRSDAHPSFSINEAAFSRFNSLHEEFIEVAKKIKASFKTKERKKEDHIPYIITGECLNGSVASLFTWSLLKTLDQYRYQLPLCITFGSPLLGDTAFQQAVSCNPTWNSCFLHVVRKDDCVPRLLPTPGQSSYKPFGTLLLCSESGCACFQDPESVIELFKYESPAILAANQKFQASDYENVVKRSEEIPFHGNVSSFLGHEAFLSNEADPYKAGIAAQVSAAGLWQRQQQNEGIRVLIENMSYHEQDVIKRQREEFDADKKFGKMKVPLSTLECYIAMSRYSGQGYYDKFKNSGKGSLADRCRSKLGNYWVKVVEDAKKKPHLQHAPLRKRWLYVGTNYRWMVEPLDIAEYYRRGEEKYITRGRSKHYELLEKWLEDESKKTQDGPPKSKVGFATEDSCFWAHVEDEIQSCRSVDRASAELSDNSEGEKSFDFEDYVMNLIKEGKVSPDIFLEKSSYMQWWREYREMLEEKSRQGYLSCDTELVSYMRKGDYETYGKPFLINSTVNPSDKSHLGPSTSGDPQG